MLRHVIAQRGQRGRLAAPTYVRNLEHTRILYVKLLAEELITDFLRVIIVVAAHRI